jgi:ribose transport system permease protein
MIIRFLSERKQQIIAGVSLGVILVVLAFKSEYFFTVNNLYNIGKQASIILIIGLGMTVVIISAGIDLSVGSLLAFTISGMAVLNTVHDVGIFIAMPIAIIATVFLGMLNGIIIQYGKVPAFIATLGMMGVARGIVLLISRGNPSMSFPDEFLWFADKTYLTVPVPIIASIIVMISVSLFLKYTSLGRGVFALGGNEEAARLSGINIPLVRIATYSISGLCCAIAGVIFAARVGAAVPSAGVGYELHAIAAVIIGGTPLTGGQGRISGTVIGALLMAVIDNGLNMIDVDPYWQGIVIGVIIVFAVMMSNIKKQRN